MNIVDLTEQYIKHIIKDNNTDQYEKSYPSLFRHYISFAASKERPYSNLSEKEVILIKQRINRELEVINRAFSSNGFGISDLEIILFVGKGTSNGHAFRDDDRFIVWIPIETYTTDLLARVFLTHEIVHALHYTESPDFYFKDNKEKNLVWRQLITEGLATYVTIHVLDTDEKTGLWADYISDDKAETWFSECRDRKGELFGYFDDNFTASDSSIGLFHAADPNDILKFRGGYYAGLEIMKHIAEMESLNPKELLSLSGEEFRSLALSALRRFSS